MSELDLRDVLGRPISFADARARVSGYGAEHPPVREFAWLARYEQALATAERELAEARAAVARWEVTHRECAVSARGWMADYAAAANDRAEQADTTRREWEVRAATSYAAGRSAGLREAAALLERAAHNGVLKANEMALAKALANHVLALAPPAAEPAKSGPNWASEMTDVEIDVELAKVNEAFVVRRHAIQHLGGSPGEWHYERCDELTREKARRAGGGQ